MNDNTRNKLALQYCYASFHSDTYCHYRKMTKACRYQYLEFMWKNKKLVAKLTVFTAAVTIRMNEFIGNVVWLSTSNSRNVFSDLSCGVMYESNFTLMKSEYSYLQYHWCPITFNVILSLWVSSIRYSSRNDGTAINTRMIAGATVHATSIIWPVV
jgi:hypothetical protein